MVGFFATARRAAWLAVLLLPVAATLGACLWLEVLGCIHRIAWPRAKPMLKSLSAPTVKLLAPSPSSGAWVGWWASRVLSLHLRLAGPTAPLLARWVAARRPDFALSARAAHLVALLRDEEFGGAAGGHSVPSDLRSLEHAHATLATAFGEDWQQVLLLDPTPVGADCVLEVYRAVLQESALLEAQAAVRTVKQRCWWDLLVALFSLLFWLPLLLCGRRRGGGEDLTVAHGPEARGAVVRVRRPGVAEAAHADLALARFGLSVFWIAGLAPKGAWTLLSDFSLFVEQQLDLRQEAAWLARCRSAVPPGTGISFPKPFGEATTELLIVSREEGVCLAEVLRRQSQIPDEAEVAARGEVSRRLAAAFWAAGLRHGVMLGGLCPGNLLLRSTGDEGDLEAVVLRCGLAHEAGESLRADVNALAASQQVGGADGGTHRVGTLLRNLLGAAGLPLNPEAFEIGAAELVRAARGKAGGSSATLRGAVLLQRALALFQRHSLCVGQVHLGSAAAAAACHSVCARLDPAKAGQQLAALQSSAADN